jgi:hypothetical protein
MKELCQRPTPKPVFVTFRKVHKTPIPQTLEGQTDRSLSFDDEIEVQQRVCAWCNKVMREGARPASHGMCPKCLEEQLRSLEESNSHS